MKDLRSRWTVLVALVSIAVLISGQVLEAQGDSNCSNLSVSTSNLNFGTVVVGNHKALTTWVSNSSSSPVKITESSVPDTDFQIVSPSLPVVVAPHRGLRLTVRFKPKDAGSSGGTGTLTTNGDQTPCNFRLRGRAILPGTLVVQPSGLSFGSTKVGNQVQRSTTIVNQGGTAVTISDIQTTNTDFSAGTSSGLPLTLHAGESANISVTFSPSKSGLRKGGIRLRTATAMELSNWQSWRDGAIHKQVVTAVNLAGTGTSDTPSTEGELQATPSSLDFGSVQVGSSKNLNTTLKNSGGSDVTVSAVSLPAGTDFTLSGLSLPLVLSAGQSFTFGVSYSPSAGGADSSSISVASTVDPVSIGLSGTGATAGTIAFTPAALNFGSVTVGDSKNMTATLKASGGSVTVNSVSSGSSEFAVSGSFPMTLNAGQSTNVTVTFTPGSSGSASASLSLSSNASNTVTPITASGTGSVAAAHSVDLLWDASASTVTGYNVYRGSVSKGPYSKINSSLNASTSYTDNGVQSGKTYYYVTTAVGQDGTESSYSNEVQAVIPTP